MMIRIFKHYIHWNLAFLVVAESVIVFGSVYASSIIKRFLDLQPVIEYVDYIYLKAFVIALATTITFYIVDLYDLHLHIHTSGFKRQRVAHYCLYWLFRYVISASRHTDFSMIPHESALHSRGYEREPRIVGEAGHIRKRRVTPT